jgi:hypothetical protein
MERTLAIRSQQHQPTGPLLTKRSGQKYYSEPAAHFLRTGIWQNSRQSAFLPSPKILTWGTLLLILHCYFFLFPVPPNW